ncbi:MAG: hypothetical protein AMJ46_12660 [Latescibacteria bacterium DG_63]|nr:MAG: hypothetical protein AMJ46_12660 [Latescibacteria bacterium DG_63]
MRTISTAQDKAILSQARSDHMRVRVDSTGAGAWVDLTDLQGVDWVRSATIRAGIDNPMMTATVSLWREWEELSLVGLMTGSRINASSTVVDIAREIKIETATVGGDTTPASGDWVLVFHGYIDDIDFGGDKPVMRLTCRDLGAELADTFIESVAVRGAAGGRAVETTMQNILNAALASPPTLYVPTSPSWNILEYKQEKTPVLTAIRDLANQIGWDLRYKWRSGTSQFELTLYEPDRALAGGVLRTFDDTEYYSITQAAISRKNIRNRIKVTYSDPTQEIRDTGGSPYRTTYIAEDATSKSKYGTRYMEIAEASTSNIDSAAEAQTMAEAIRDDLKEPTLTHVVDLPYFFAVELGDYYTFSANDIHYDTNQSLAVVGYTHTLEPGKCRTILQTRGIPSAGTNRWLEIEGRPGVAPTTDDYTDAAAGNPAGEAGGPGQIIVTYDDPRIAAPPVRDWAYTECHVSTSSGFTPSNSTLKGVGRTTRFEVGNLIAGTTYYIKLIVFDSENNVASTSSQVTQAAGLVGPGQVDKDSTYIATNLNTEFGVWSSPNTKANDPPDHWTTARIAAAGEASTFVEQDLWGSGEPVYYSTSVHQTGGHSIVVDATVLANDGTEDYPSIMSAMFPSNAGKLYGLECNFRQANVADFLYLRFEFYDDDESTYRGWASAAYHAQAVDTFYTVHLYGRALSTSRLTRVIVGAAHQFGLEAAGLLYIDRAILREVPVSFEVYLNAATTQTIATATWDVVEFDEEEHDRGGDYDFTNDEFTVVEKGTYHITATVAVENIPDTSYVRAAIYVDGSAVRYGPENTNATGGARAMHATVSAVLELDVGEDVDIRIYHNAGGNRDLEGGVEKVYFGCRRVT